MNKPVRIQRSRQHKQVSPNGLPIVYVGRPSKWGNPFKVKTEVFGIHSKWKKWLDDINDVIKHYELYIKDKIERKELDIKKLKGKNLACWCKIGDPCHADILLKLANDDLPPSPKS